MINLLKKIIPGRFHHEMELFFYKGHKYICPFCNYSSNTLAPIGFDFPVLHEKQVIGGRKRMAGCYNCGSTDRERLMYVLLKEKFNLIDGNKELCVLHMAPEKKLSELLLKQGFRKYVCGDLFAEGYHYPKHVQNIDVLKIPFDDSLFDIIICNHVLEHIPDDLAAMKELRRVLKCGGTAVLQVPISKNSTDTFEDATISDPKEREFAFGQHDHLRIYGQDYSSRLMNAGFMVNRINISETFMQYGLNKEEDIFLCSK
ncbi:MAG TPA: class I SAM-dependent methyltransferase [Bacteroidia bacterium]